MLDLKRLFALMLASFSLILSTVVVMAARPDAVSQLSDSGRGDLVAARQNLLYADALSDAFRRAAERLRPSVVSIRSVKTIRPARRRGDWSSNEQFPPELRRFFGGDRFERFQLDVPNRGYQRPGLGTGVIVSTDGYVLTNNHVVRGADEVRVNLFDDRSFDAEIVGTDAKSDLAVLKIAASGLTPAVLGNIQEVHVGQWVVAIGSPFGLDQTVTAGIVSATGRANMGITDYEDFIQTDAAINPGNSGGPLVNMHGEVIGINTAIASRTGGYMGIGFAIPINMVREVKDSIIETGGVERGWLGVLIQPLTNNLARRFEFEGQNGVLVGDVVPDSPADKVGLKPGDIVVEFDGQAVDDPNQLRNAVARTKPNNHTTLVAVRKGRHVTLNVTVGRIEDEPQTPDHPNEPAKSVSSVSGLGLQTLTAELASHLGYDQDQQGMVVTEVESGSPAHRAGFRPRDVIISIDGITVSSHADFRKATENYDGSRGMLVAVKRDGFRRFVVIKDSD